MIRYPDGQFGADILNRMQIPNVYITSVSTQTVTMDLRPISQRVRPADTILVIELEVLGVNAPERRARQIILNDVEELIKRVDDLGWRWHRAPRVEIEGYVAVDAATYELGNPVPIKREQRRVVPTARLRFEMLAPERW